MNETDPTYVLAALTVPGGNRIKKFFSSGPESPAHLLENPPSFRWAGFDLTTLGTAQQIQGDCLEVRGGDRKVLHLYQDGTFITRVAADSSFLGWGQPDHLFPHQPCLDLLPIVEWHASFVHLYSMIVSMLKTYPESIRFRIELHNAKINGNRLYLTPYTPLGITRVFNTKKFFVQFDKPQDDITIPTGLVTEEPDSVAYEIVENFVGFFDMPVDQIPFTKSVGEHRAIDLSALKKP